MTHDEIIEVVTAHKAGNVVQYWHGEAWRDYHKDKTPRDFAVYRWRVKPPEPRTLWVVFAGSFGVYSFNSKEQAERMAERHACGPVVEFREVLPQ